MKERRRHKRGYFIAEVRVRSREGGTWISGATVNISEGGIGMYLKRGVEKGKEVIVKMTVLVGNKLMVTEEIPAKVRWVQPVGRHYAVGIRFTRKISKKEFPVTYRCIEIVKGH